jgi:hypothetical protein
LVYWSDILFEEIHTVSPLIHIAVRRFDDRRRRCALEEPVPAIASLEDLKSAQKDLRDAKDLNDLKAAFKKWRRIGWKNVCKLWLEERTPEQLKGEGE